MTEIGFDNEKYLDKQAAAILERVNLLRINSIWNLGASFSTITMIKGAAGV